MCCLYCVFSTWSQGVTPTVNDLISLYRYGAPSDWQVQDAAHGPGHRHGDGSRLGGATVFRQLRYVWSLFSDSSSVDGLFFCSSVPLRSTLFLRWWWINKIFSDWKKGIRTELYVCVCVWVNNGERHWIYTVWSNGERMFVSLCWREW